MTEDELKAAKMVAEWRKNPKHMERIAKKVHEGQRCRRIRDFYVSDTAKWMVNQTFPTCVYHVPSGLWHGFTRSYSETIEVMLKHPEADPELLEVIFST